MVAWIKNRIQESHPWKDKKAIRKQQKKENTLQEQRHWPPPERTRKNEQSEAEALTLVAVLSGGEGWALWEQASSQHHISDQFQAAVEPLAVASADLGGTASTNNVAGVSVEVGKKNFLQDGGGGCGGGGDGRRRHHWSSWLKHEHQRLLRGRWRLW
ncbi:hypothetical protein J5N97_008451 [Dioscorea zingiberensis]|uniref:Uncharacterized protein n=1 Tax=Dioscorea zingiberensis TaxID=325984 RepID=A0A9D5CUW9_9LILI|nr:hypothetical protein J5N97_008451 [Dioscorea zingiberensis]